MGGAASAGLGLAGERRISRAAVLRRRWQNNAFRSVSSNEDGGKPANSGASGASNQAERDARASAEDNAVGGSGDISEGCTG
jgi:hypothetical protein